MCGADVCSFVLVSRLFGLALEVDRHVPRLILQDVATRVLHRMPRIAAFDSWRVFLRAFSGYLVIIVQPQAT